LQVVATGALVRKGGAVSLRDQITLASLASNH
jgi:hypothetical protein